MRLYPPYPLKDIKREAIVIYIRQKTGSCKDLRFNKRTGTKDVVFNKTNRKQRRHIRQNEREIEAIHSSKRTGNICVIFNKKRMGNREVILNKTNGQQMRYILLKEQEIRSYIYQNKGKIKALHLSKRTENRCVELNKNERKVESLPSTKRENGQVLLNKTNGKQRRFIQKKNTKQRLSL